MSYCNCKTFLFCLLAFLISNLVPAQRPVITTAESTLAPYIVNKKMPPKNKNGLVVDVLTADHPPPYNKTDFIRPEITFAIEYKRLHPNDRVRVFVPFVVENRNGICSVKAEEWLTILSYFKQVRRVDKPLPHKPEFKPEADVFPLSPEDADKFSNAIYPGAKGMSYKNTREWDRSSTSPIDVTYFTEFEATDKNGNVIELFTCTSKHFLDYLDTKRAADMWNNKHRFAGSGDVTVMVGDANLGNISRHGLELVETMQSHITKPHTVAAIGNIGQHYDNLSEQHGNILFLTLEPGKDVDVLPFAEKKIPSREEKTSIRTDFARPFQGLRDRRLRRDVTDLLLAPDCVWAYVPNDIVLEEDEARRQNNIYVDSMYIEGAVLARGNDKKHNLKSVIVVSSSSDRPTKIAGYNKKDWKTEEISTTTKGVMTVFYNRKLQIAVIRLNKLNEHEHDSLLQATDISGYQGDVSWTKAASYGIAIGSMSYHFHKRPSTFSNIFKRANSPRASRFLDTWITLGDAVVRFDSSYLNRTKNSKETARPDIMEQSGILVRQMSQLFTDKSFRDEFRINDIYRVPGIKPFSVINTAHINFAKDWNEQATRDAA